MIDPQLFAALAAAFGLGLLSSAHCVGMCGGIMGALTLAIPDASRRKKGVLLLSYNLGRIGSYLLMGVLLGALAGGIPGVGGGLRIVAGLLLIAMGLYLANWWRGLLWLERGGRYLWAYIQPLGKGLLPVTSAPKALFLGVLWGWLPCGLVYTALAYAMTHGGALEAGSVMLVFGLGTLPAVLATGLAAQQFAGFLIRRGVRTGFALLIILFGVWTLLGGGYPGGHSHEHHHHEENSVAPEMPDPAGNHHSH